MRNIKDKVLYLSITAQFFIFKPQFVLAQGGGPNPGPGGGGPNPESYTLDNPLGDTTNIRALLEQLLDLLIMIAVPIAILFLVYAGLLFVTARGNEEQLKKARKTLLYTVIGIALVLGAALIANVISGTITQLKGD